MDVSVSVRGQRSTEERWAQVDRDAREPARARGEIQIIGSYMKFVQNFTPPDFQVKNFTPPISPNFNSLSKKKHKK